MTYASQGSISWGLLEDTVIIDLGLLRPELAAPNIHVGLRDSTIMDFALAALGEMPDLSTDDVHVLPVLPNEPRRIVRTPKARTSAIRDTSALASVAAVIGTACRNVGAADALEHVAGYVLAACFTTSDAPIFGSVLVTRDEFEAAPLAPVTVTTGEMIATSRPLSAFEMFASAIKTASLSGWLRPGDVVVSAPIGTVTRRAQQTVATHPVLGDIVLQSG